MELSEVLVNPCIIGSFHILKQDAVLGPAFSNDSGYSHPIMSVPALIARSKESFLASSSLKNGSTLPVSHNPFSMMWSHNIQGCQLVKKSEKCRFNHQHDWSVSSEHDEVNNYSRRRWRPWGSTNYTGSRTPFGYTSFSEQLWLQATLSDAVSPIIPFRKITWGLPIPRRCISYSLKNLHFRLSAHDQAIHSMALR